jgi:hypothetical protein
MLFLNVCPQNLNTPTQILVLSGSLVGYRTPSNLRTDIGMGVSAFPQFYNLGLGAPADTDVSGTKLYLSGVYSSTNTPLLWGSQSDVGDAYIRLALAGVRSYALGVDNSDSDSFIISTALSGTVALGYGNILSLNTSGTLYVPGDIYSTTTTSGWINWSASLNAAGWDATTSYAWYKKIGHLVFFNFYVTGTSNQNYATIDLPFPPAVMGGATRFTAPVKVIDNGVQQLHPGLIYLPVSTATGVDVYINYSGVHGYTASGTKTIQGEFWYQTP